MTGKKESGKQFSDRLPLSLQTATRCEDLDFMKERTSVTALEIEEYIKSCLQ